MKLGQRVLVFLNEGIKKGIVIERLDGNRFVVELLEGSRVIVDEERLEKTEN